jgi:hypothetical protein
MNRVPDGSRPSALGCGLRTRRTLLRLSESPEASGDQHLSACRHAAPMIRLSRPPSRRPAVPRPWRLRPAGVRRLSGARCGRPLRSSRRAVSGRRTCRRAPPPFGPAPKRFRGSDRSPGGARAAFRRCRRPEGRDPGATCSGGPARIDGARHVRVSWGRTLDHRTDRSLCTWATYARNEIRNQNHKRVRCSPPAASPNDGPGGAQVAVSGDRSTCSNATSGDSKGPTKSIPANFGSERTRGPSGSPSMRASM